MIISVHLPKTAGISFADALEQHFGGGMLRDYADMPINTPASERKAKALRDCLRFGDDAGQSLAHVTCIHGHFLPLKYALLAERRGAVFVTWVRNPVDRAVSHYHYWKRTYDPATAPALQRAMMEEGWSLERFCLGPELRNLYAQFLFGFPLESFAFVGITEHFEEDLRWFSGRFLSSEVAPKVLNAGDGREGYAVDPAFRREMEQFHDQDMRIYRGALERRRSREDS